MSRCDLGLKHPIDAAFLSMETALTIGYGVPNIYWNSCYPGFFLISAQSVVALLLDASIIGLFFARIARPQVDTPPIPPYTSTHAISVRRIGPARLCSAIKR